MKRSLATLLALFTGLNGAVMLAAGRWWYGVAPGVTTTGPFNPHFVKDIGAAYLVTGLVFAWLAWKPAAAPARGAAAAGAAFLALHAGVHLTDAIGDPSGLADLARDFPGVLLPALIAVWIAWPANPEKETRHA